MTDRIKKLLTIRAQDFVGGDDKTSVVDETQIKVLEENPNVFILDARNDKALSGAFERYGLWHQGGKRGVAPTLEGVRQFLEQRGRSCETNPENCGASGVFTIRFTRLAEFYNQLPASPGTAHVAMTPEEYHLMKDMEDAGLFTRNAKGELKATRPKAVLMAMSRSPEPDKTPRAEVFSVAFIKLLPLIDLDAREAIIKVWESLSQQDQRLVLNLLEASHVSNTRNIGEVITALGAYSYFAPDHRMGMAGLLNIANQRCMEEKGSTAYGMASCLPFWGDGEKAKAMELFWKLHNAIAPALRKKVPYHFDKNP